MQSKTRAIVVMVLNMGLMVGCSTGSVTKDEGDALLKRAQALRQEWNKEDPQFEAFAKKGYGYALFPEITKGGLLVGGAHGRGVVYEKGQHIGYGDLTQMSAGFQAGLQDYSELIVFENQAAMDKFKRNEIDFSANASAVYADKGAAASAQFVDVCGGIYQADTRCDGGGFAWWPADNVSAEVTGREPQRPNSDMQLNSAFPRSEQ